MDFCVPLLDISRGCKQHCARALSKKSLMSRINCEPLHVINELHGPGFFVTAGQLVFVDFWSDAGSKERKGWCGRRDWEITWTTLFLRVDVVVPFREYL